jgi:hypothetical protein
MVTLTNHCKGCRTYMIEPYRLFPCRFQEVNKSGECPCCTCIVKVMCNSMCEDFKAFSELERNYD